MLYYANGREICSNTVGFKLPKFETGNDCQNNTFFQIHVLLCIIYLSIKAIINRTENNLILELMYIFKCLMSTRVHGSQ